MLMQKYVNLGGNDARSWFSASALRMFSLIVPLQEVVHSDIADDAFPSLIFESSTTSIPASLVCHFLTCASSRNASLAFASIFGQLWWCRFHLSSMLQLLLPWHRPLGYRLLSRWNGILAWMFAGAMCLLLYGASSTSYRSEERQLLRVAW